MGRPSLPPQTPSTRGPYRAKLAPEVHMWWLTVAALAASPCDTSRGSDVVAALRSVHASHRADVAAAYLAENCRLPTALGAALRDLQAHPPAQRSIVVLSAAAADPALLVAACTGGPRALADMAALARDQQRKHLWDRCGLQRHTAVDRATFESSTLGDPVLYLLAAQAVGPTTEPVLVESLRAIAGAPPAK